MACTCHTSTVKVSAVLDPTHLTRYSLAFGAGGAGAPTLLLLLRPCRWLPDPEDGGHGGSLSRRNLLADLDFSSPTLAWNGNKAGSR